MKEGKKQFRNTKVALIDSVRVHIDDFEYEVHIKRKITCPSTGVRLIPIGVIPGKTYVRVATFYREHVSGSINEVARGKQIDFSHDNVCLWIAANMRTLSIKELNINTHLTFIAEDKQGIKISTFWGNSSCRPDVSFQELIVEVSRTSQMTTKKMSLYSCIECPILIIRLYKEDAERVNAIEEAINDNNNDLVLSLLLQKDRYIYAHNMKKHLEEIERKGFDIAMAASVEEERVKDREAMVEWKEKSKNKYWSDGYKEASKKLLLKINSLRALVSHKTKTR
jgi:hypothetical protein